MIKLYQNKNCYWSLCNKSDKKNFLSFKPSSFALLFKKNAQLLFEKIK